MRCNFIRYDENSLRCSVCGYAIRSNTNNEIFRDCDKIQDKNTKITITNKLHNLIVSTANYVKSGMQNVSDEKYKERLNICNGRSSGVICPYFNDNKCDKCGCYFIAKLRMASEKCPLTPPKWGPVEES